MQRYLTPRIVNLAGVTAIAGLMGFGLYLQLFQELYPCNLCIFQRIAFIALAATFLVAGIHNPERVGGRIYAAFVALFAIAGIVVAGRHVWLQHLPPDQVPACGPSLDYMLEVFPLSETIQMVFEGSGDCANVSWSFLCLSIPAWALVWFIGLGIVGTWVNLRGKLQST